MDRGRLIVETHHGFVCANAGVDQSNSAAGEVTLLPEDPDASARRLRSCLEQSFRTRLAVIVSDTFGRPWREGLVNVAIGVAGLMPLMDYRGGLDSAGRRLEATTMAWADELAGAAEPVMGKTRGISGGHRAGIDLSGGRGFGSWIDSGAGEGSLQIVGLNPHISLEQCQEKKAILRSRMMTAGAKTYLTILKSAFRSAMSALTAAMSALVEVSSFVNVRPDGNDVRPDGNDVGLGGDGIVEGFGQGVDNSLGLAGLHACGFKLAEGFQGVENSGGHDALRCLELNTTLAPLL